MIEARESFWDELLSFVEARSARYGLKLQGICVNAEMSLDGVRLGGRFPYQKMQNAI